MAGLEDLKAAASILKGRKVAAGGQAAHRAGFAAGQARRRSLGLDRFSRTRCRLARVRMFDVPGMNGDTVGAGQYSVSTSTEISKDARAWSANLGGESHDPPPPTAVQGRIADPREFL